MVQWELQLQHITPHRIPDRKSLGFAAHCIHPTQPAQCSWKGNVLGSGSKTQTTGKASRTESSCKTTEKNRAQRNMGCSLWTQSCGLSVVIAALFRGTGEGREKHARLRGKQGRSSSKGVKAEPAIGNGSWTWRITGPSCRKYEENKETRQLHRGRKRNERSKDRQNPRLPARNPLTEGANSICLKGIFSPLQIL